MGALQGSDPGAGDAGHAGDMLYVSRGYGAHHHGTIAQGRQGDWVAADGWQGMAADTDRSLVYRVSVQRKSGGLIMDRRCQPTVFLRVYEKDVRIAIGCHTPIVVQRQCLPPMIKVLHLPGRYLENMDHLEKGVTHEHNSCRR